MNRISKVSKEDPKYPEWKRKMEEAWVRKRGYKPEDPIPQAPSIVPADAPPVPAPDKPEVSIEIKPSATPADAHPAQGLFETVTNGEWRNADHAYNQAAAKRGLFDLLALKTKFAEVSTDPRIDEMDTHIRQAFRSIANPTETQQHMESARSLGEELLAATKEAFSIPTTGKRGDLPQIMVQLAKEPTEIPERLWEDDNDYVSEEKIDGARLVMHVGSKENRFTTRNKAKTTGLYNERTDNVPFLRDLDLKDLGDTILDGEVVMPTTVKLKSGEESVGTLTGTTAILNLSPDEAKKLQEKSGGVHYVLFDILKYKGEDLKDKPWHERRAKLEEAFKVIKEKDKKSYCKLNPYNTKNKKAIHEGIVAQGGEGSILKNKNAPYIGGNRGNFIKVKKFTTVDGFITGSIPGQGKYEGQIGAFVISGNVGGEIKEIARVIPGDDELRRKATDPKSPGKLNPEYLNKVIEMKGMEWTRDGRLRHPRIERWRPEVGNPMETFIDPAWMRPAEAEAKEGEEDKKDLNLITAAGKAWKKSPGYKLWRSAVSAGRKGKHLFGKSIDIDLDDDPRREPAEDLMLEHALVRRTLSIYRKIADELKSGGRVPAEVLRFVNMVTVDYIQGVHEAVEEQYIFPYYVEDDTHELVKDLYRQHAVGKVLLGGIEKTTELLAYDAQEFLPVLLQDIELFIKMYQPHGAKEDAYIFATLRDVLSPKQMEELKKGLRESEKRFGKEGFERINEGIEVVEKVLGIERLESYTPELA